ncbi:kinase binding protein [Ditylenchus destructor]|nr:kinase binding protein [Ditylenchus destructor]
MCISPANQPLEYKRKHCRMKSGISTYYELQPDPYDFSQRQSIRVCIFRDVKNAIELRRLLRDGDIDAAMIRPELVAEPFVLLAAANRAIHQAAHNRMYTRSLSAELIYSLSPTKNISESLNVFGIAENSQNLIVAVFDDKSGKKMVKVAKRIDGVPAPLHTLRELADIGLIKKVYQLPTEGPELNAASISDLIVARIVSKDLAL